MARSSTMLHVVACVACAVSSLGAQTSVGIGPLAGYYRPLGRFDPTSIQSTALPQTPSDLSGVAWGVEGYLAIRRWRIEGIATTASSTIPGCLCPGGQHPPTHARVTMLLAEAQYDISPSPDHFHLWLGGGPARVEHGGDAYAVYGSPRSWGAAGGIELAATLMSALQIVAHATSVAYSFNISPDSPQSFERGSQVDALVYIGLRWHHP